MRNLILLVFVTALLLGASTTDARNTIHKVSIASALAWSDEERVLTDRIALYFGSQKHRAVEKRFGTYTYERKTNAFGKSDEKACKWAFLSAVKALQDRALREGGNAVINIHSNYMNRTFTSQTEFECGAGALMAGVTMAGDIVKLKE